MGGAFDNLPDEMQPWEKEEIDWAERDAYNMVQDALTAKINHLSDDLTTDELTPKQRETYIRAKAIYRDLLSTLEEWQS